MAGRGPAPKPVRSRQRATAAREAEMTDLVDTGELHGPELPDGVLPDGRDWHPQTKALWEALRRWPLLADEPDLGWQFLIDTALMHDEMWKGRREFAPEVRLRLAKFAATPEDRMRLRVRVTQPVGEQPLVASSGSVADISSRRVRLTS